VEEEKTEARAGGLRDEETEMMERLQEEIRNMPVSDHLVYMLHSLSALAIGRMGLTPEAAARRDLDQARLAIDAFKVLMGVVERVRPAAEMGVHRGMLSQLQLAYVGAGDLAAPAEGAEADAAPDAVPAEEPAEAPPKGRRRAARKRGGQTAP
jgi:hypothetical protein